MTAAAAAPAAAAAASAAATSTAAAATTTAMAPAALAASEALNRFLTKHRAERGQPHTHTSLGYPQGAFYIPHVDSQEFYRLYGEAVEAGAPVHLTEKHKTLGPVCIDLDFRHKISQEPGTTATASAARIYRPQQIARIVDAYMGQLSSYVDLKAIGASSAIRAYIMEKPQPRVLGAESHSQPKVLKDGVHILIPDLVTTPLIQTLVRKQTLPLIAQDLREELRCSNSPEDVFDEAVIERNGWMMYGSKKPDDAAPYKVTHVLTYQGELRGELQPLEAEFNTHFSQLFSLRNKPTPTPLLPERVPDIERMEDGKIRDLIKATPRLRQYLADDDSTSSSRTVSETGDSAGGQLRVAGRGSSVPRRTNNRTEEVDMQAVKQLVALLDVTKRANDYQDWIRLGFCLHHLDPVAGLAIWDEFSRGSDKYEPGGCERYWRCMRHGGGLGMGSLHMWARMDNPAAYATLTKNTLRELISQSMSGTHHDIAKVMFHMYRHEFVCASIKFKVWYQFRGHRWVLSDSGYALRMRISTEMWREFVAASVACQQNALETQLPVDQDRLLSHAKKLTELALLLKSTSFKDNIMKECAELFYTEDFEEKLDSNCNLIGFENGVYDLDTREFRDGRPDDYVSFTTGNEYVPYDPSHPHAQGISAYLGQVLTNPEVKEYVLKLFASFLHGAVRDQKFYIWTGSGANSKSKLVELFEKSFGGNRPDGYCCKFPITLLTQKRAASNSAVPELARAKGKRFASLQEPSDDEKLNIGLMKELSGGDRIMARALFKEPVEYAPQFKMLLLCNHLPAVPSDDGGTWRRIRLVEFTSKFVENPVAPNEFPIDYDLSEKLDVWRTHFMSMLIHYYQRYQVEGMHEPEPVLKVTKQYRENNDHVARWVTESVEVTKNAQEFLALEDAFDSFSNWCKAENIGAARGLKRAEFDKAVARVTGIKCTTSKSVRGYKSLRFKSTDEDEANATA